jgi:NTP pyrophosphatase (non-canonical NTP hydrolase)
MSKAKDPTPLEMVIEFATKMEQPLNQIWPLSRPLGDARWRFIAEEYSEAFDEAYRGKFPERLCKELADLVYVTYGYAATYGWDLDEAVRRIHQSNMSKLGLDGKPLKRPDGKVLKGPNYRQPDLTDLVEFPNEFFQI